MNSIISLTIVIFCLLTACISILLTQSLFALATTSKGEGVRRFAPDVDMKSYAFEGDDVPVFMPINKWDSPVFMQVEESVHYSIDDLEAGDEWISSSPFGAGSYREGPGNLTFVVDVFHHLHCLRIIRAALVKQDIGHYPIVHINHCLSYMREAVLCAADTTLEPGDFTTRNFTEQRTGATHECRDWRQLYKRIEDNWNNWYQFIRTSDLLTMLLASTA